MKIRYKIYARKDIKGIYKIDVPLYKCSVCILFKEASDKLVKYWEEVGDADGCTYNYLKTDGDVWIRFDSQKPTPDVVAHELCHATQMIMKNIGHDVNGADEPFAYLLGYLIKEYGVIHKKYLAKQKKK